MPESSSFSSSRSIVLKIGGLLVLCGALALLFFPRLAPPSGLWWATAWNALHFPGFVLITVGLERVLSLGKGRRSWRIAAAVLLALVIAVGSEIAQGFVGRSASLGDVFFDTIGIAFATIVLVFGPRWKRRGRLLAAGAGVLVVLVLLTPGWKGMVATAQYREVFPDLAMFSRSISLGRWQVQGNATLYLDTEAETLTVAVGKGIYSGVSCYPGEADWSAYSEGALNLVIENPSEEEFQLGIRIDDDSPLASRYEHRFNGQKQIAPGRNELRLPLSRIADGPIDRKLDLSRIKRLALFTGREEAERVFVVVSAFLD